MRKNFLLRKKSLLFSIFFALLSVFSGLFSPVTVLAEGEPATQETVTTTETTEETGSNVNVCSKDLGALAWRLCPETDKISEATDWVYEKIENILVINPVEAKDKTPIYEVWKYFRGVTNIVFIIFLLVVIYSQVTGLGISNYGLKKALPKLLVAVILVNLSFHICSLAVDLSNIIGISLRGLFTRIQELAAANTGQSLEELAVTYSKYYSVLAKGGILSIGALAVAIETGTIWMLIPTVLAALVAVVSGFITVALRQAVVVLLVMISPLAIVCYILPNTDKYFLKWKQLLIKMLVFFPLMSLLFGAANLAGWAIIAGANDGFVVLLGKAVQVFPLFFSWSLMKMSDTFLGKVNAKLSGLARPMLAANRSWADSHRALTRENNLARNDIYTPSARLSKFLNNRRIAREADITDQRAFNQSEGLAYRAERHYDYYMGADGKLHKTLSREGLKDYEQQARDMDLQRTILADKNNFNAGFGGTGRTMAEDARLKALDKLNIVASDRLYAENVRSAIIDYDNAEGRHKRFQDAIDAHMDEVNAGRINYRRHKDLDIPDLQGYTPRAEALERYSQIADIAGNAHNSQYIAADAAHAFNAQMQVRQGKFQKYFEMTVPTQDVVNRLQELTMDAESSKHMDSIVSGLRILNIRGDTDLIRDELYNICANNKLQLGTQASQTLANFLMTEVKDSSPILRRFGKYINLETAQVFNNTDEGEDVEGFKANGQYRRRHNRTVTYDEYINSEYEDDVADENGHVSRGTAHPKRGAETLLNGTSFKGVERLAFADIEESILKASKDANGNFDMEKYKENSNKIFNSILPNIVGDQFSYLSGSEQMFAIAQYITGMRPKEEDGVIQKDANGRIIYEEKLPGFLKDYINSLPPEEADAVKRDFQGFIHKRSEDFTHAQVSNQLAHTKSDMLGAQIERYKADARMADGERHDEAYYTEKANETFRNSIDEQNLKMFARSAKKGLQGDSKAGLIKVMGWDNEANLNRDCQYSASEQRIIDRRERAGLDEDDGDLITTTDVAAEPQADETFVFRQRVQEIFSRYHDGDPRGTRASIEAAYNEVLDYIDDDPSLSDAQKRAIRAISATLSSISTLAELQNEILGYIG